MTLRPRVSVRIRVDKTSGFAFLSPIPLYCYSMAKKTAARKVGGRATQSSVELVPAAQFVLLLITGIALVIGLLYLQQPQDIRNQAKELVVDPLIQQ